MKCDFCHVKFNLLGYILCCDKSHKEVSVINIALCDLKMNHQ